MYYNARWYDPALGRFAQADTIIEYNNNGSGISLPLTASFSEVELLDYYNSHQYSKERYEFQSPIFSQNLDRYSYAANNPLSYNDPTGHCLGLAGGLDTGICTVAVFAGPPGWALNATIIFVELVVIAVVGKEIIDSLSLESRGDGGAQASAEHLSMLLGVSVAGFFPHPGRPDPNKDDRNKNAKDLRNTLKSITENMKKGDTLQSYLERQNWTPGQIKSYTESLQRYVTEDLANDVELWKVKQELADQIINLAGELGVH